MQTPSVGPGLLGVLLRVRRGDAYGRPLALVVVGPPVSDLVATTLLASLIQVGDDRTRALLLVSEDVAVRPAC